MRIARAPIVPIIILLSPLVAIAEDTAISIDAFPNSDQRDEIALDFDRYSLVLEAPRPEGDRYVSDDIRTLEGKIHRRQLFLDARHGTSAFAVFTNYRDLFREQGVDLLFVCEENACGDGGSSWAAPLGHTMATNISADEQYYLAGFLESANAYVALFVKGQPGGGVEYLLDVIEPRQLETGRVELSVDSMLEALERSGKVAVYDIYFATGEAVLDAASAATIDTIGELLRQREALSLYVVGHTDDTGDYLSNIDLSERRASSVVRALIESGISAARLTAFGAGPHAPASSNRDEPGRASNRRVELVERLNDP